MTSDAKKLSELRLPHLVRPEGNGRFQYLTDDEIPEALPSIGSLVIVSQKLVGMVGHYTYFSPRQLLPSAQIPVTVAQRHATVMTMPCMSELIVEPDAVIEFLKTHKDQLDAAWQRWAPARIVPPQRTKYTPPAPPAMYVAPATHEPIGSARAALSDS